MCVIFWGRTVLELIHRWRTKACVARKNCYHPTNESVSLNIKTKQKCIVSTVSLINVIRCNVWVTVCYPQLKLTLRKADFPTGNG